MSIDKNQVKKVAKLSRISLSEKKANKLKEDLDSILKFIETLNELDTKKTLPMTSVSESKLQLRNDEIKSKNIREKILKNSPEDNKDYFVVPKVIE